MKKLKMIVTSVVVLAIVGGALAFKTKTWSYCVRIATANPGNCTAIKYNFKITDASHAGTEYYIYCLYDGVPADCTGDANGSCINKVKLTND